MLPICVPSPFTTPSHAASPRLLWLCSVPQPQRSSPRTVWPQSPQTLTQVPSCCQLSSMA